MDCKRVVLGIGNPGAEYEQTRHNVGFMVLDQVAERCGLVFQRLDRRDPEFQSDGFRFSGKVKARIARGHDRDEPFVLVKPLTYVNCSGQVAGPMLRAAMLSPESLFVVVDDLSLPLGRIRIRPAGSSGGHHGLASIEATLASSEYPRLRLGIGHTDASTMVEHVLGPFLPDEREVLGPVLDRAAKAVIDWLGGAPLQTLMGRYNGPGNGPGNGCVEEDL